ncbi:hypothetical protein ET524_08285 [Senegalimassilia faecalis]|uniref:Glutamine amidotransferase domain-containing protein n=1 Tax=Senegalimassilia faecalis TaxID=2509433 RepID=A0A4Q2JZE7_9ACTN|nr:hypothetical protein [Senegalimassilia faecalis]RXZ54475.1 hypothetical protein ET524_08285 [Senegalimassilia faecalis]
MFPTLDKVRAYAAEGRYRRVPVCMELLADRFTPTEALRCLRSVSNHVVLLENAEADGTQGRYSFLGFNPTLELSCTNGLLRIREGGTDDGEVMAVEDAAARTFGVQFHPESVMTPDGAAIIANFLALV